MNYRALIAGIVVAMLGVGVAIASTGGDETSQAPASDFSHVSPADPDLIPVDPDPNDPENHIGQPPNDERIADCEKIAAAGPDGPSGAEFHACEVQLAQVAGYVKEGQDYTDQELDAALSDYEQAK